jgi:hypothetical protein
MPIGGGNAQQTLDWRVVFRDLSERVGFDQPTGVFVQLVRLRVAGRNTVLLISAGEDKLLRDVAGIVRKLIHGRVLRMGLGRILGASSRRQDANGDT